MVGGGINPAIHCHYKAVANTAQSRWRNQPGAVAGLRLLRHKVRPIVLAFRHVSGE